MYSPKVDEKLIPVIYRLAKSAKKPMTKIVNEILSANLYATYYCHNCNNPIEAETGSKDGYCDNCDSLVFLDSNKK